MSENSCLYQSFLRVVHCTHCSLFITPMVYWYGSLFCWSTLKYQFLLEISQGLSLVSQVEQCNCKGEFLTASTGTGNALSACFISCPFSCCQRTRRLYTTQIMFVSSKINVWRSCWDSWLPTQSLVGPTWRFQVWLLVCTTLLELFSLYFSHFLGLLSELCVTVSLVVFCYHLLLQVRIQELAKALWVT